MSKSSGRPSRAIVITSIAEGADTLLRVGEIFPGGAPQLSKVLGYSAYYIRDSLKRVEPLPDAQVGDPMGPATLRGISFQYLDDQEASLKLK